MTELTIRPHGERKIKPRWINRHIEFETGKEQIQGVTINPLYGWELKFSGTAAQRRELEDFFNARKGSRETFYWTDRDGVQHVVRFATDELDITDKWGEAYECTVILKKVYP